MIGRPGLGLLGAHERCRADNDAFARQAVVFARFIGQAEVEDLDAIRRAQRRLDLGLSG